MRQIVETKSMNNPGPDLGRKSPPRHHSLKLGFQTTTPLTPQATTRATTQATTIHLHYSQHILIVK